MSLERTDSRRGADPFKIKEKQALAGISHCKTPFIESACFTYFSRHDFYICQASQTLQNIELIYIATR